MLGRSWRPADFNPLWERYPGILESLGLLQERLGHRFADVTLLFEALTHRSALNDLVATTTSTSLPWNERLEFLGDAVLGLAVSRRLMERREQFAEGQLSRMRASLINQRSLAKAARALEVGRFLLLGKGAVRTGARSQESLLADAMEALIGAVFSDGGFEAADLVVGRMVDHLLAGDLSHLIQMDYKTVLQELSQERFRITPTYEVLESQGPDHAKEFLVRVMIGAREVGLGRGPSKKLASQIAAQEATFRILKASEHD
jgi:ribonuclease III